jgi:hypothetical protein
MKLRLGLGALSLCSTLQWALARRHVALTPHQDVMRALSAIIVASSEIEVKPAPKDFSQYVSLIAGLLLTLAMCAILPLAVVGWLAICAFKRQSSLLTMYESEMVWSILDWRPTIAKLFNHWKS